MHADCLYDRVSELSLESCLARMRKQKKRRKGAESSKLEACSCDLEAGNRFLSTNFMPARQKGWYIRNAEYEGRYFFIILRKEHSGFAWVIYLPQCDYACGLRIIMQRKMLLRVERTAIGQENKAGARRHLYLPYFSYRHNHYSVNSMARVTHAL